MSRIKLAGDFSHSVELPPGGCGCGFKQLFAVDEFGWPVGSLQVNEQAPGFAEYSA